MKTKSLKKKKSETWETTGVLNLSSGSLNVFIAEWDADKMFDILKAIYDKRKIPPEMSTSISIPIQPIPPPIPNPAPHTKIKKKRQGYFKDAYFPAKLFNTYSEITFRNIQNLEA